jgi:hypothetical protein
MDDARCKEVETACKLVEQLKDAAFTPAESEACTTVLRLLGEEVDRLLAQLV